MGIFRKLLSNSVSVLYVICFEGGVWDLDPRL